MKYVGTVFLFLWIFSGVNAQQNHFVYIQTENKQPFYVRVADRLLSSSSSGYVVIPKLKNGSYDMHIGFPKNEWPTQKITLTIKDRDEGFVLKDFEEKGWGLFNMQTLDIVMSSGNKASDPAVNSNDGFADVLADVVSTPSIKQKPADKVPVKEEPVKKEEVAVKKEEPVVRKEEVVKKEETAVNNDQSAAKSVDAISASFTPVKPQRILSSLDQTGRSLVFVDVFESRSDTIRVFIPYPQTDVTANAKADSAKQVILAEAKKTTVPEKKDETVIETGVPELERKAEVAEPKTTASPMINSDCKDVADNSDFLKLRKKMAAQKSDENMIVIAKKAFHGKCFTTEQVNNLSVLFLRDEGRYNFFDAAYPRVIDSQNFGKLASRLSDEYYLNRFKAMIRR